MALRRVIDLQLLLPSVPCGIELALASIDARTDRVMLAHLRRPFLVMRTLGSFNHPGPDEAPIAILLRQAAQKAAVGHDPPIGGPAWVAAQAGPLLTKHRQNTASRSYKGGLGAAITH